MQNGKISKVQFKEAQVHWDRFFSSRKYRDNLERRILDGNAQSIEILLYHMTYGKPKETLDLQNAGDGIFVLHIGGKETKQAIEEGVIIDVAQEGEAEVA